MDFRNPLAVVTPTLDGPVLTALAIADTSFTVGQLTRMLPFSDEGIRRVLKRLVEQGVVRSEVHGPVNAYELNRAHLAAQPILELARMSSRLIHLIDREVHEWQITPTYAAVFGSAARGSASEGSDIDLFVVKPYVELPAIWERQIAVLEERVTAWTGNDARVLEMEAHEVTKAQPVIQDIIREGLTVFGEPAWLRRQLLRRDR